MTALESTHRCTPSNGPRPAGDADRCFYCGAAVGEDHVFDCVCYQRLVMMRAVVEFPVAVQANDRACEHELFRRNEGTWCADNLIGELQLLQSNGGCLCEFVRHEYVGEDVRRVDVETWQAGRERIELETYRHLLSLTLDMMTEGRRDERLEQQIRGLLFDSSASS